MFPGCTWERWLLVRCGRGAGVCLPVVLMQIISGVLLWMAWERGLLVGLRVGILVMLLMVVMFLLFVLMVERLAACGMQWYGVVGVGEGWEGGGVVREGVLLPRRRRV